MRTEYFRLHYHDNTKKLIDTESDYHINLSMIAQQLSAGSISAETYNNELKSLRTKLGLNANGQCATKHIKIKSTKKSKSRSSIGEIAIELSPFGLDTTLRMLGCGDTRSIMGCGPNVSAVIPDWRLCMANVGSAIDQLTTIAQNGKPIVSVPFRVEWNGDPEDDAPNNSLDIAKSVPHSHADKRLPSCGRFGIRFPEKGVWRVTGVVSGDVVDILNDDAAPRAFIVCEVDTDYYMNELIILRDTIQHALDMELNERSKLLVRWD